VTCSCCNDKRVAHLRAAIGAPIGVWLQNESFGGILTSVGRAWATVWTPAGEIMFLISAMSAAMFTRERFEA